MKILVNLPSGLQEVIEVGEGGDYSDQSAIVWHEGRDGSMPNITLGGMVRSGSALVFDQTRKDQHDAAVSAESVPKVVTMVQAQLALLDASLISSVEAFIATQPEESRIFWGKSLEVRRDHPLVATVQEGLSLTDSEIDDLFIAASQKV